MINFSEYSQTIALNDLRNNNIKFQEYHYSLFGLIEEVAEFEEAIFTKTNIEHTLEEAGDVLFYVFQTANRLGITEKMLENDDLDNKMMFPNVYLGPTKNSYTIDKHLYFMRQSASKIMGIVKKSLRKEEKELNEQDLNRVSSNLGFVLFSLICIVNEKGHSVPVILEQHLEKKKGTFRKIS
jgi:NTP pyrophosphatase (non-canonical NTP hydrolase)